MIHRILFDEGYEDFTTSTELLLKYPKAQTAPNSNENNDINTEIIDGKRLYKYI